MAQTTTAQAGCRAEVWLDNSGGTLTNISGSSTQVDPHFTHALGTYRARNDGGWPKRLDAGKDSDVRLNVLYTSTADEGWDILREWWFASAPGARTLTWYAPSKTAGADVFSGEFRIRDLRWTHSSRDAGPLVVTADLVADGEVTESTYSS